MTAWTWRRVASIGPYFAVTLGPTGPGWRPLRELLDDPGAVTERAESVRVSLARRAVVPVATVPIRVGASIDFLGLAARLVSPALGTVAFGGVVPVLEPEDIHWQRRDEGPMPIAVGAVDGIEVTDPDTAARRLFDGVIAPILAPAVASYADAARLSEVVLWGNVASALAGAAAMIERAGAASMLDPTAVVASLLAARGPLMGAGHYDGPAFARHSCCLLYRVAGSAACGDCVLR
jgi:hypothetical protein